MEGSQENTAAGVQSKQACESGQQPDFVCVTSSELGTSHPRNKAGEKAAVAPQFQQRAASVYGKMLLSSSQRILLPLLQSPGISPFSPLRSS